MKKLMIAAAAAAMVGSGFAANEPQVYDMTITLKSTECNNKGATYAMLGSACNDEAIIYRTQVTTKIYGKFWGCGCEVIASDLDSTTYAQDVKDQNGFIFWTKNDVYHDAGLSWTDAGCIPLQIVGSKAKNVEGAFTLELYTHSDKSHPANYTSALTYTLAGAGYGTVSYKVDKTDKSACTVEGQVIKQMSGYLVGTRDIALDSAASGCYYCGGSSDCGVWLFCDSGACGTIDKTTTTAAAFGSFTLKYNAAQSKSVANGKSITEIAFKNNKLVAAELVYEDSTPDPDAGKSDTVKALEKNYKDAVATYELAKEATAVAKANAETAAASEYLKTGDEAVTATTSTKGKEYETAQNNAKTLADEAEKKLTSDQVAYGQKLYAYHNAVAAYDKIKDSDDATGTEKETAKTAVDTAKTDMDTAAKKLSNNQIKAADEWVKLYEEYDAAKDVYNTWQDATKDADGNYKEGSFEKEKADAQKTADDAAKAYTDAQKAEADAKDEMDDAQLLCISGGGDCI